HGDSLAPSASSADRSDTIICSSRLRHRDDTELLDFVTGTGWSAVRRSAARHVAAGREARYTSLTGSP
ncbi:hypothetical protein KUCAC02_036957, partial [Chaenocephalus aceratus]